MLILLLSSLLSCTPSDTKYNVYNTEPGASISSPVEGQAFDERSSVSFRGRVVDNQDVPSELYITWSSDLDGVLQEGRLADGDGNVSFVTANLSVGSTPVAVEHRVAHIAALGRLDEGEVHPVGPRLAPVHAGLEA